jgi:hypothetical protein
MTRLALTLGVFVMVAVAPAADPDPKSIAVPAADLARALELVTKLASPSYAEREDASRQLRVLGRNALAALEAGANDSEPEVRERCERLLPKARAEHFDARLTTFQADTADKYFHDLPGWDEFKKLVGHAEGSRLLYADMLKQEDSRNLIAGLALDPAELARLFDARKQDLHAKLFPRTPVAGKPKRYEPTARDATLFLILETKLGDKVENAQAGWVTVQHILSWPSTRAAINSDTHAEVIRKLAGAWVETRTNPKTLWQAIYVSDVLKLKEGLGLAGRIIKLESARVNDKIGAARILAKTGSLDTLQLIKMLFDNDAVVRNQIGVNNEIRVQDAALAMAILLTGQQPADYGFRVPKNIAGEHRFTYSHYSFESAEARKAAFAKFAEWEDKNRPAEKK